MSLALFFSPVPEVLMWSFSIGQLGAKIDINYNVFPTYRKADIALIGLDEYSGHSVNKPSSHPANEVRKELYKLFGSNLPYKIVDLGNLNAGVNLEETNLRIREVGQRLLEENVLPIYIGGSHDLSLGQYFAYQSFEKMMHVAHIDAFIDLETSDEICDAHLTHLRKLLVHQPNYLFSYTHLGYQSFLIDPNWVNTLKRLHFKIHRLGEITSGLSNFEAVLRGANLLSIDFTAIKMDAAPANAKAQPFGLSGEEICQLCWYAGQNDDLSSLGLYELNFDLDQRQKTAKLAAVMIWYFIEGFYNRKKEKNFHTADFNKYVVQLDHLSTQLTFFKGKKSEKWWIQVPSEWKQESLPAKIPCNYEDYEKALNGELPACWLESISNPNIK